MVEPITEYDRTEAIKRYEDMIDVLRDQIQSIPPDSDYTNLLRDLTEAIDFIYVYQKRMGAYHG